MVRMMSVFFVPIWFDDPHVHFPHKIRHASLYLKRLKVIHLGEVCIQLLRSVGLKVNERRSP